jgi:hypothetical protein
VKGAAVSQFIPGGERVSGEGPCPDATTRRIETRAFTDF